MLTAITSEELFGSRAQFSPSERVALVPTMGALHQGHAALIHEARQRAEKVIVSIFVNPIQFGPNEDYENYPRTLAQDMATLKKLGVDLVFLPNAHDMYDGNFQTFVVNSDLSSDLCGRSRPDHFRGVLTVVLKLFNLVAPDVAIFGKKDFQQYKMIAKMVKDLAIPVEVVGCPIIREDDGLALSSRNRRLSADQRRLAPLLFEALGVVQKGFIKGQRDPVVLLENCQNFLADSEFEVDYLEIRKQEDLSCFPGEISAPGICLAAAKLGDVRLIDNIELEIV